MLLVATLLLSATQLFAGLRYEFSESSRTEETSKSSHLIARAVVEGQMSRLDVISGTQYQPGNYIITHGDQRIFVVDPETKSYVEYATGQRRVNPDRVKISGLKSNFTEVPDTAMVAGYPTRHFRLQLSYDIEVMMGTIAIRQHVDTVIDKWTTSAFDHVIQQYRANLEDLKTGNPEIDNLMETEASKFKGLALKERSQVVTSAEQKSSNRAVNLPTTRKRTREMAVSKIEEADISPNLFAIPVGYVEGVPAKAPGTTTTYLTMQPDDQ